MGMNANDTEIRMLNRRIEDHMLVAIEAPERLVEFVRFAKRSQHIVRRGGDVAKVVERRYSNVVAVFTNPRDVIRANIQIGDIRAVGVFTYSADQFRDRVHQAAFQLTRLLLTSGFSRIHSMSS